MRERELGFKQVSGSDILWGYIAQAFNLGAGLLILPFVLVWLSPQEVGLFFVFLTLGSLAQLLELGFQPTLARNTAYIFSGAKKLQAYGMAASNENDVEIDLNLLASLIQTAKKIYRFVALVGVVVIVLGGGLYVTTLIDDFPDQNAVLFAWVSFSLGYIINFYFGYVNALLQGKGDVTQANKVIVISKSFYLFVSVSAISMGFGLLGLGIATLLAALIGRLIALCYLSMDKVIAEASRTHKKTKNLFSILWPNTKKLGLVFIGAFLIQRFSILLASSYLGLEAAASYGMSMTILSTLLMVSTVICQIQVPLLSSLQSSGNKEELKRVMGEIYLICWFVFCIGLTFIFFAGDYLLALLGSDTKLLPANLILLLGAVLLLELTHSVSATYLTTTNNVPFLSAALWSGLFVAIGGFILVGPMGVLGLILAQGAVQLAYNNWKWPLAVLKNLNANMANVLYSGTLRIKNRL